MAPNASAGSLPHLQIVDKLTELPLVHSALGYANQRYAALKGSSRLVNATLDRAEQSLQLVVNTGVVPVLNKFEQPIHYADNIAVQGLDMAVTKFNVIQKQGGELAGTAHKYVDQTRAVVDQTAEQVRERLNSVKATTLSTVQAKVSSVLTLPASVVPLLDQILTAGDHLIDYLLPEAKGSSNGTSTSAAPLPADDATPGAVLRLVIARVRVFSDKVQKRLTHYSTTRWLPALFDSALTVKSNVLAIVANGAATGKQLLTNGHSSTSTCANSTTASSGAAKSPAKNASASSPATSSTSSSPSSNGDVKHNKTDGEQQNAEDQEPGVEELSDPEAN